MRKKYLIVFSFLAITVVGYFLLQKLQHVAILHPIQTTSSPGQLTNQPSPVISPIALHVPVNIFEGELGSFGEPQSIFTNSSTGITVSFRLLTDLVHRARNDSFDVYINQKKVNGKYDEIGGQGESLLSFSPNNRYFGWRSRSAVGCGGGCHDFIIYTMDLLNKKIISIQAPRRRQEYAGYSENPTRALTPFIESYSWNGDALRVIFSFVLMDGDYKFYRVSPKEFWHYDLATKQYTLLETIRE